MSRSRGVPVGPASSRDPLLSSVFLATLFASPGFLCAYHNAWSEPTFSACLILNLFFVIRHYETHRLRYYGAAAICAGTAALTRYIGYFLVSTLFIYTVYHLITCACRKRAVWAKYLLLNSLSYIPVILYLSRI